MTPKPTMRLPNGTVCHLVPDAIIMKPLVKYMRWEIFDNKRYTHPGFELKPTDTVLDIGGNIGVFVLWAAPQVKRGRIVTIEPNPTAVACLRLNVEQNNLRNVTVLNAAAGADGGMMELTYTPGYEPITYNVNVRPPWFYRGNTPARMLKRFAARWTNQETFDPPRTFSVPQISVRRVIEEQRLGIINYMKVDCEGSEFEVFRAMGPQEWDRIERVALEYHEYGRDRRVKELVVILENNGFEVEVNQPHPDWLFRYVGARFGALWARKRNLATT